MLEVMAEASLRLLNRFVFSQEFFFELSKRSYLCLLGRSFILVGLKSFLHGRICGCLGSFSVFDHDVLMLLPMMAADLTVFMSVERRTWWNARRGENIRWYISK